MKAKIIINPSSGKKTFQDNAMKIMGKLVSKRGSGSFDLFETRGKDDARIEASKLKKGEYDFVMCVGGDGTINEVVNGLIESGSETPLAILAAGTVNDFASSLKIPRDVKGFSQMIDDFNTIKCDAGFANGQYFLNVLAGGMITDVAYKVSSDVKTVFGKMGYYLEGAKDLGGSIFKSLPLRFEFDGRVIEEKTFLFLVANSTSVGGFSKIAPQASVCDGLLDVCIIKKLELLKVLPIFMKIPLGEHIKDGGIEYFQTSKIKISCLDDSADVPLDFDGEQIECLPAEIENRKGVINLIVPKA